MRRILVPAAVVVLGSLVSMASPAQAASGPWSVASAGDLHTCGINAGNSLYCWGQNVSGQIGDGTTDPRPSPTKIGASGAWATVAAGASHTCAITTGKSLYCWGSNGDGHIGDGTTTPRPSPKKIGSSGVWSDVAAGVSHTCAITTGSSLYCWGNNGDGQIGDGTTSVPRLFPKKIGTTGVWAGVVVGALHTCAISTGKSLYCWGYNGNGQVGDGTTDPRSSPKKIGTSGAWSAVSSGDVHTCAITTGKSLYCWGYNSFGQVGDGTNDDRFSPKKVGTSGVWARISAGGAFGGVGHTCATTTGNSLYCWGHNGFGQVGDGTIAGSQPSPKKVGTNGVWGGPTGGGLHTCAISTGKSLYCWGNNEAGQIGDGTTTSPQPLPKKIP